MAKTAVMQAPVTHESITEFPMTELPPSETQIDTEQQSTPRSPATIEAEGKLTLHTITKLISSAFAFFVAGTNDGSLGALIPYILSNYSIGTGSIAILYGITFGGWVIAAIIGNIVRAYIGSGGALILGAALQLCAHALRVWDPPFGLFAATFLLAALGQAFQDAQANSFVATVKSAHRWLGCIHASYAFGGAFGPLIATAIASSGPEHWTWFYAFPLGMAAINLSLVSWAFREDLVLRRPTVDGEVMERGRTMKAWEEMKATARDKSVWLLSMFYFFYLGVGVTAGGWLVTYLVDVRGGQLSQVGYVSTAFYGGLALGRLLLIEPTHRFGERRMLLIYSLLCLFLQLIAWLVPSIVATGIAVTFMAFLLGPYFPAGMSVATKLLPARIHTPALGIIFVIAQAGGAIFPAITGVIATAAGVKVLQPIVVGLIVAMGVAWGLVPKVERREE